MISLTPTVPSAPFARFPASPGKQGTRGTARHTERGGCLNSPRLNSPRLSSPPGPTSTRPSPPTCPRTCPIWKPAESYGYGYHGQQPTRVLADLVDDFTTLRPLLTIPQPAPVRARLCRTAGQMAGMTAIVLHDLGSRRESRAWFTTAARAAESGDHRLHAWVLAREAMVPLNYGAPKAAADLADQARRTAGHRPTAAATSAARLEVRADPVVLDNLGQVDVVEGEPENAGRVLFEEVGGVGLRVRDGHRAREAGRVLEPVAEIVQTLDPVLPLELDTTRKTTRVQPLEEPLDERVAVLQHGAQMLGCDDEEHFHGVVEGQHRGEGERLGQERLLDALAVRDVATFKRVRSRTASGMPEERASLSILGAPTQSGGPWTRPCR